MTFFLADSSRPKANSRSGSANRRWDRDVSGGGDAGRSVAGPVLAGRRLPERRSQSRGAGGARRVRETQQGVGSQAAAADNFKKFLSLRPETLNDPLAADARKAAAAVNSHQRAALDF